jgi:hypothetical protein
VGVLAQFDAQIEVQQTEIAHPKTIHHLLLETSYLLHVRASHDRIVDIDSEEKPRVSMPTCVHGVHGGAAHKAQLFEAVVELRVPSPGSLTEAVQRLPQFEHLAFLAVM